MGESEGGGWGNSWWGYEEPVPFPPTSFATTTVWSSRDDTLDPWRQLVNDRFARDVIEECKKIDSQLPDPTPPPTLGEFRKLKR